LHNLLITCRNCISGLNCSDFDKQWHSQELQLCASACEVQDLQLLDLNWSARLLVEAMLVVDMDMPSQEGMRSGMSLKKSSF
jgi:hypothetical protein